MKIKTLLFLFICSGPLMSQSVPNAGFENWTSYMWFEDPDYWDTNNNQLMTFIEKDTNAYQGNYALKAIKGGYAQTKFSVSKHPLNIKVYAKSILAGIDKVSIDVYVYSAGSLVDSGKWESTVSINNWTLQTIPVSQNSSTSDSLEIVINGGGATGTTLYLDDFSYEEVTGIARIEDLSSWKLYPNPLKTHTILSFDNPNNEIHTLTIYSATGQLLQKIGNINSTTVMISKKDLASGVYYFRLSNSNHHVATGKLAVD